MRVSELYVHYLQNGKESIFSDSYNVITEIINRSVRVLFLTIILLIVTAVFLVSFMATMNISLGLLLAIGVFCTISAYGSYIKLVVEYERLMQRRIEVIQKLEYWQEEEL